MTKKTGKPKQPDITKQWAYRPTPTQTPHEIMSGLDAANMVKLLHELLASMPSTFRTTLNDRGFLQFKVKDYDILITRRDRFERPNGGYGRVTW